MVWCFGSERAAGQSAIPSSAIRRASAASRSMLWAAARYVHVSNVGL